MLKSDYDLLEQISRAKALSLYKHSSELIPKIIHRIWLGDKPMPDSCIKFGKTWEENHPGWIMKLWRDPEELPFKMRLHHMYENGTSYSAKSNFMRLEIIYNLGGIYVDTDFECIKNLEPIIRGEVAFAGISKPRSIRGITFRRKQISGAIFGAQPRHPWIERIIQDLLNRPAYRALRTGPHLFSKFTRRFKDVKRFKREFFYPYCYFEKDEFKQTPEKFLSENTHAVHHWRESWFRTRPVDVQIFAETALSRTRCE